MSLPRIRLSRRWRIVLISVLSIIVLLLLALRFLVAPILSHELVSLIEARINAKLTIGDVFYHPPYGLSLRDCRLVFTDPKGATVDLLDFAELNVSLAELPVHRGPLQIQDLTIRGPVIRLIRTADGFEGQTGLIKPDTSPQTPNDQKLSDILRLRHIAIENGQVVYQDQTSLIRHPFAWSGIDVRVITQPQSAADYDFHVDATNGALSSLTAAGDFNVDALSAAISNFALTVGLSGGKAPAQLPPELQALLERYRVKGDLLIHGAAGGSLSQPGQSKCQATCTLHDASAYSPEVNGWLEGVELEVDANADAHGGQLKISTFSADSGGVNFSLKRGATVTVDPNTRTWKLKSLAGAITANAHAPGAAASRGLLRQLNPNGAIEFSADLTGPLAPSVPWPDSPGQISVAAKNLSLHPIGCVAPVTVSIGPVALNGKILSVRNIQVHYGSDQFVLSAARFPIASLSRRILTCNELTAALSVHPNGLPYPPALKNLVQQFQPGGHYAITARTFTADFNSLQPKLNYDVLISGDHGELNVSGIPISQITFDAEATPGGARLADFSCQTLQGTITASNGAAALQPPFAFSCNAFLTHIDLGQLDQILKLSSGTPISGFADVRSSFSGSAPVNGKLFQDSLRAQGQFEVSQGNLWAIPALKKIEDSASIAKDALTVGRAAAYFRIANQDIELQDAAVNAPLFGVMGFGDIGFDGMLDIHAIPVLLGDWKETLSKTSDVLGDVAGTIQGALNNFTGGLIYEVHVTGDVTHPQIVEKRGAALSRKQAQTVGNMAKQPNDSKPIDLLNNNTPAPAPAPSK